MLMATNKHVTVIYRLFLVRFWPSRAQHDTLRETYEYKDEYKDATGVDN